jgi:hypothetical protein
MLHCNGKDYYIIFTKCHAQISTTTDTDPFMFYSSLVAIPLVPSLSPWKFMFNLRPVHMGFMVDNIAIKQVFLSVLVFFHVTIIPLLLDTHSTTDTIKNFMN